MLHEDLKLSILVVIIWYVCFHHSARLHVALDRSKKDSFVVWMTRLDFRRSGVPHETSQPTYSLVRRRLVQLQRHLTVLLRVSILSLSEHFHCEGHACSIFLVQWVREGGDTFFLAEASS